MTAGLLAGSLGAVLLLAGCSDDEDEPVFPPDLDASVAPPAYDPELEPAAAVLALVPDAARVLTVTDFDQLRLQLGTPTLTSADPAPERDCVLAEGRRRGAALTDGLLRAGRRPAGARVRLDPGRRAWEAHFGAAGRGMGAEDPRRPRDDDIRRAVDAGVGPLAGDGRRRATMVGSGAATPGESWAADAGPGRPGGDARGRDVRRPRLHAVRRRFGPGVQEQLAPAPRRTCPRSTSSGRSRWRSAATSRRCGSGPAGPTPSTGCGWPRRCRRPTGVRAGLPARRGRPATGRLGYALGDPRPPPS